MLVVASCLVSPTISVEILSVTWVERAGSLIPWALDISRRLLLGGTKLTQELVYPELEKAAKASTANSTAGLRTPTPCTPKIGRPTVHDPGRHRFRRELNNATLLPRCPN